MARWTDEQLSAIQARDTALIVSAAAGSGKTSVLVERLLLQLLNKEENIPADRIIVATFTNDAAAEMKQRLIARVSEELRKDPDNEWLFEQQLLLQSAKISTINSFCFDLVRENLQTLDISYGFRIIEENEEQEIIELATSDVLEIYCAEHPERMGKLLDCLCHKGDSALVKMLHKLLSTALSVPFPESWLDRQLRRFDAENIDDSEWAASYIAEVKNRIETVISSASVALSIAEGASDKAYSVIAADISAFEERLAALSDNNLDFFEKISSACREVKYGRMSVENDLDPTIKKSITDIREKYKKSFKDDVKRLAFSSDEFLEDMRLCSELFSYMADIVKLLMREIAEIKKQRNALGFSDAEQLSVRLLAELNDDGSISKTPLARELTDYYRLILIDEFQDSNSLQALIFRMLSKDGTADINGSNMFVVGDIKQSIYRFRQAEPKIFSDVLKAADEYSDDYSGKNAKIELKNNFRSSRGVIDFANFVFENIMTEEVGEVTYKDGEQLVFSRGTDAASSDRTKIIAITRDFESVSGNVEAAAVAAEIYRMINDGVSVSVGGEVRKCRAGDFCILARARSSFRELVKELENLGISANAESGEGYLASSEISTLIDLLTVIDNPLNDIALTSVLMSPMFAVTADEMAKIRLKNRDSKLFSCVKAMLDDDGETALSEKLRFFVKTHETLRYNAACCSLERLIRRIYDSTDFMSVVNIYGDSERKRANLRLLIEYARQYDEGANGGLSGFLRYFNGVIERKGDFQKAPTVSEAENAVAIKTIHGSKGLEFPFVFLFHTVGRFNKNDERSQFLLDSNAGAGFAVIDREIFARRKTFPYKAINCICRRQMRSEEMRLLYVALTRARERLFITLDLRNSESSLPMLANRISAAGSTVTPGMALGAASMQEWLLMALLLHRDGRRLRELGGADIVEQDNGFRLEYCEYSPIEATSSADTQIDEFAADTAMVRRVESAVGYRYDDSLVLLPAKLTVTDIAKEDGKEVHRLRRPKFAESTEALTGAERGTAIHAFMQYADFERAASDVGGEIQRLVMAGLITPKQGAAADLKKLAEFFRSDIYKRLSVSPMVERERKFMISMSELGDFLPNRAYSGTRGMLQGIADCVFKEGEHLVLIDYKTDYVKEPSELSHKYSMQLKLYAEALRRIYGMPVGEAYIYSFSLSRAIPVDLQV